MNTTLTFKTPTRTDVEYHIARARQMRSEYMAASVKSGLRRLRTIFAPTYGKTKPV